MLLIWLFDMLCFMVKFTYGIKLPFQLFVHDFSSSVYDVLGWFLAHSAMIAMGLFVLVAWIDEKPMRIEFARVGLVETFREWIDLLVWNNSYDDLMLAINAATLICATIWIWVRVK